MCIYLFDSHSDPRNYTSIIFQIRRWKFKVNKGHALGQGSEGVVPLPSAQCPVALTLFVTWSWVCPAEPLLLGLHSKHRGVVRMHAPTQQSALSNLLSQEIFIEYLLCATYRSGFWS